MGCWNGTCGISQLPILVGEKIRVFILKPSHGTGSFVTGPNSFVYTTDMFDALGIPFVAEYDDYGSVENIVEDYNTKIIHDALSEMVVLPKNKPYSKGDHVHLGEERHYEIVDIQDTMVSIKLSYGSDDETKIVPMSDIRHDNGEDFYDDIGDLAHTIRLIERNVFEIDNRMWAQFGLNKTAIPGLFYVRENVWQAMIADIEKESEHNFGYKSRETILKHIDEFLIGLRIAVESTKSGTKEEQAIATFRLRDCFESFGEKGNHVGSMFGRYGEGFNASLYREALIDSVKNGDIDFAKKMLSDIADTYRFFTSMMYLRKSFIPQCGQGSQCIGENYHEVLNKVVAKEIDTIKHMWDEE